VRTAAAAEAFVGCTDADPTHFIPIGKPFAGCVWELAVLEHERASWVSHLLAPAQPDLAAYLAEALPAGPVGLGRLWPNRPAPLVVASDLEQGGSACPQWRRQLLRLARSG
jgi:hypothetical protein